MYKSQLKGPIRLTTAPPLIAEGDSPDQRALLYLLSFLVAGFDWVRSTRLSAKPTRAGWLEHWEDEEYTYLETRIPGDASELEVNLHVHQGVIFARIRRRNGDGRTEAAPAQPDLDGRARSVSLIEDWGPESVGWPIVSAGCEVCFGSMDAPGRTLRPRAFFSSVRAGSGRRIVQQVLPQ